MGGPGACWSVSVRLLSLRLLAVSIVQVTSNPSPPVPVTPPSPPSTYPQHTQTLRYTCLPAGRPPTLIVASNLLTKRRKLLRGRRCLLRLDAADRHNNNRQHGLVWKQLPSSAMLLLPLLLNPCMMAVVCWLNFPLDGSVACRNRMHGRAYKIIVNLLACHDSDTW